jgi:hypothetical protein
MKVIVSMFEISDFLFTDSPLGPVTGAKLQLLVLFDVLHRVSGLDNGLRPIFTQATLTDLQFETHVDMVWWYQIFDPFRPWKGTNFSENVQLHETEHCILEISTIKLPKNTCYLLVPMIVKRISLSRLLICSLVPWSNVATLKIWENNQF